MDSQPSMAILHNINPHDITLTKYLDEGAYSKVYLADYRSQTHHTKHTVVVKKFTKVHEKSNEAYFHHLCQHPAVVVLYGHFKNETKQGLVMEYCSEGSLNNYLANTKFTDPRVKPERERFAKNMIDALYFLHTVRRIIHRDFKPGNILVQNVNGELVAKLGDFGFATQLKPNHDVHCTVSLTGTARWMSPERFAPGVKTITFKVDIYAFGLLMLIFIQEGLHKPFPHIKQQDDVIAFIKRGEVHNLSIPEEHSTSTTRALIWRCLSKDPEMRPDAKDIINQFESGFRLFSNGF